MNESQERMFEFINENSLKERQKENSKRIRQEEFKLKREKKERFWKRVRSLLALVAILATIGYTIPIGVDALNREFELRESNKYMNNQMNYVCPELERGVLSDGTVYLFDNSEESLHKLSEQLMDEYGFSKNCAIYIISQKFGDDGFNKVVRSYGYTDKDDFLEKNFTRATSVSESGQTVYAKEGSYKVFENNVQLELVNKVSELKKMMDSKSLESKGLGL